MNRFVIPDRKIYFIASIIFNLILTVLLFATLNDEQIYVYFNSDTLYIPSIYRDLFINNNNLNGWHLNGAPNFFPDMLLFFMINLFFDSFIPAAFTFSLIQLAILLALLGTLCKQILPGVSYLHLTIGGILMSFFLLVTFFTNNFVYTFYILSISYHLSAFIMALAASIMLIKFLQTGNNRWLIILWITATIAVINDRLFIVLFSLPVFALLMLVFKKTEFRKRIFIFASVNIFAIICGMLLSPLINSSLGIVTMDLGWKLINPGNVSFALNVFLEQHFHHLKIMDLRGIIDILWMLSLIIHSILLVKILIYFFKGKEYDRNELFYLVILVPMLFIIMITPVINGSYVSISLMRYNVYSLYLGIFSYAYLIFKIQQIMKFGKFILLIFICMIFIAEAFIVSDKLVGKNLRSGLKNFLHYYPEKVQIIDSLARSHNLSNGVAPYWDAKYITMFSKENLNVFTIFESLSPWYHVMNEKWYYYENGPDSCIREFNFIVTDEKMYPNIEKHLGIPEDTLLFDGDKIFIFKNFVFEDKIYRPHLSTKILP